MRSEHINEDADAIKVPTVIHRTGPRCKLERDMEHTFWVIFRLAKLDATQEEIAGAFGVDRATLRRFCIRYPEAQEVMARGYAMGNISLRRSQQRQALKGNTKMLIWLGKQRLGQRDKADVTVNALSYEEALAALG